MCGISIASARQAHFLRLAIELEVVRTLGGQDDTVLAPTLQSLVLHQKAALDAGDLESFNRVDHAFHHQLYSTAEVKDLWQLMPPAAATWTACAACTAAQRQGRDDPEGPRRHRRRDRPR